MGRALTRSAPAAGVLALLLAVVAAVLPAAAGPGAPLLGAFGVPVAYAADDLAISTAARYTVVPDKGVVRVTVTVTARNEKPDSTSGGVVTRYFYDGVSLGVQPEATRFRATQGDTTLRVTAERRDGFRLVSIRFRGNVFFGQEAKVRLTYDLPAGKPRSASDVRVGPAFASFVAWAFGDRGSVRIDVPAAFAVDIAGAELERTTSAGGVQVYRASTTDPLGWFAWVNARNDDGLTRRRIEVQDGDEIIVRAWPEDSRWRSRVETVLGEGVPELVERIGLPWPVDGPLSVLEIHTPLLEGYAGFYNPDKDEITISEDLDDLTIVHEASHAWFNDRLFTERWITEGLAEEYAAQVVDSIGGDAPGPGAVTRTQREAFALNDWPPPSPIESDEAGAREDYGYRASFRVVREIADEVGPEGMREVFAAAEAGTTAYPGEGAPERSRLPNDWRRFLDLAEALGGAENVDALLAEWALSGSAAADLDDRAAALAAFDELVAAGDEWAPPVLVRMSLDRWAFEDASAGIDDATSVIELRDEIDGGAAEEGLDPPDDLEATYEAAADEGDLEAVTEQATRRRTSLAAVAAATDAAEAPRDWLVELGLMGRTPDADLVAAREAWEAGDSDEATATADLVVGTLAVADEAGTGRALVIGTIVIVLLLLLIAVILIVRRARRRARRRAAAEAVVIGDGGTGGLEG